MTDSKREFSLLLGVQGLNFTLKKTSGYQNVGHSQCQCQQPFLKLLYLCITLHTFDLQIADANQSRSIFFLTKLN